MTLAAEQIVMITAGQLQEFATNIVRETISVLRSSPEICPLQDEPKVEYRYGLRGIRELFGVSHATAQRYKDTFLRPAVDQRGRKIRINVAMAQRLYDENRNKQDQ